MSTYQRERFRDNADTEITDKNGQKIYSSDWQARYPRRIRPHKSKSQINLILWLNLAVISLNIFHLLTLPQTILEAQNRVYLMLSQWSTK